MLVSAREATRLLARATSGGEAQARALLRAGLAGRSSSTGGSDLLDQEAVLELANREVVDLGAAEVQRDLGQRCPHGLLVLRLPRTLELDATGSWHRVAGLVSELPPMPVMTAALLTARARAFGGLPWVATLCGFVVLAADLVGLDRDRFVLRTPGPWAEAVRERRLPTPRGGRAWYLWEPPRLPQAMPLRVSSTS